MNYGKIYNALMQRAKDRILDGYVERHHAIPRCMGGDNSRENIVILTAPEHYVAHLLLVKMYPGNRKLLWAASAMTNGTKRQERSGNKMYEWLRKRLSLAMSERIVSDETRAKLSAAKKGKPGKSGHRHTAETKAQMSSSMKGRVFSPEHREALRQAKLGTQRGPHSPNHVEKIRMANRETWKTRNKSHFQDEAYKARQAEKMREVWERRRHGLSPMPNY